MATLRWKRVEPGCYDLGNVRVERICPVPSVWLVKHKPTGLLISRRRFMYVKDAKSLASALMAVPGAGCR